MMERQSMRNRNRNKKGGIVTVIDDDACESCTPFAGTGQQSTKLAAKVAISSLTRKSLHKKSKHAENKNVSSTYSASKTNHSVTPFRAKVFSLTRTIPEGKVTTYGQLAKAIGCKSAQAIGQALKSNPYATYRYQKPYPLEMVPCHRVVATDRTLGGFSGARKIDSPQLQQKIKMLKEEGVSIAANTRSGKLQVDKCCIIAPNDEQQETTTNPK
eukprot:m.54102 g.54102  ORF g.54102 m.54102 type:complete len:214 (-) comp7700_c0_seq3:392-1033(-)